MINTEILFVIVSANEASDNGFLSYGDVHLINNNKKPLLETLLSVRDTKEYKSCKYIVCLHDDVYIRDNNFLDNFMSGFLYFDYFGVAGTNMILTSCPKWHVPFGNKKYCAGLMEHQESNGVRFMTSFGPYPLPVTIIDGVFMAFKKEAFDILENVPELDGYHLYDYEICTQLWSKGYKGGVIGIHLFHESKGEGINSEEYKKYSEVFKNKWNKYTIIGG